jgi:hypothetical protein
MRAIYVDETGSPELDYSKTGVQRYFVLTGVILNQEREEEIRRQADAVRARHFQAGPFRSNKVGPNLERRLRILRELAEVPVKFYCLAIDKAEVTGGLIYRVPFLRFAHKRFYDFLLNRALYPEQGDTTIVAEQYGRDSFMEGQKNYIRSNFRRLWPKFEFEIRDKSDILLGVADFLGGSLARCVDPTYDEDTTGIMEVLRDQFVGVQEFPPRYIWQLPPEEHDTGHDLPIRTAIVEKALVISESLGDGDEYQRAQEVVLRRLIFQMFSGGAVYSDELMRDIHDSLGWSIDKRVLTAEVIAKLRDAGVVIVGGDDGYKLPHGLADIQKWLEGTDRKITPMIRRLELACEAVKSTTEIDLLAEDRWAHIQAAAKKIPQGSFTRGLEGLEGDD